MIYINFSHAKGGTYNLCTVSDGLGRFATSLKGQQQALRNYRRKYGPIV
jgi:hypothetical protein